MEEKGPFKVKERIVKYQNPYGLVVYEDQVIRPDGENGVFGWVRIGDGVSMLPVDAQQNVYLGKEFQYGLGLEQLEPSSGGIDKGEKPLDAAKRELEEELGLKANEWISFGVTNPITGRIKSTQHLFLAKGIYETKTNLGPTEIIGRVKIPLDEAYQKAMSGEIVDTQSQLLIIKAYNHFKGI